MIFILFLWTDYTIFELKIMVNPIEIVYLYIYNLTVQYSTDKAIRSPYWENTGSVFGGASRCD